MHVFVLEEWTASIFKNMKFLFEQTPVVLLNRTRNIRIWGQKCANWTRSICSGTINKYMPLLHSSTIIAVKSEK